MISLIFPSNGLLILIWGPEKHNFACLLNRDVLKYVLLYLIGMFI